ncbi:MAG TPA: hypothetical protein VKP60_05310, partial [Magnetospirillaceae bacterium]|nr:hypothetical protein [Magnetospirillaceae bacterium]
GAPQEVALLGADFFGFYDAEFDVQHGKIILYKPVGCETTKLAYWPGPSSVADMVSNTAHSNLAPLNSYNFPHINLRLTVGGRDMLAALDTGYRRSSLSLVAAHSLGLTVGGVGMAETDPTVDLLDGFSTETWVGGVDSVAFGQEVIAPAKLAFRSFVVPAASREPAVGTHVGHSRYNGDDMMLGADFLIAHRVFISQSQRKVYFSPAETVGFLGGIPKSAALSSAASEAH